MLLEIICMFKDSKHHLLDSLKTWIPHADSIILVEGGTSQDNCVQLVKDYLQANKIKNVAIRHTKFTDFGSTRNKCFDYSKNKCEFQMILDDSYHLVLDNIREELAKVPSHYRSVVFNLSSIHTEYQMKRTIRTKSKLRYTGKIHEHIEDHPSYYINKVVVRDVVSDYMIQRTDDRFEQDIKCLKYSKTPRDLYIKAMLYYKGYAQKKFTKQEVEEVFNQRINTNSADFEENFMVRVFLAHIYAIEGGYKPAIRLYLEASIIYPPRCGECYYYIYTLCHSEFYLKKAIENRNIGYFRLPVDKSIYSNTCENISAIDQLERLSQT